MPRNERCFVQVKKNLSERKGTIQKGLNEISDVCDDPAIRVSSLESYLKWCVMDKSLPQILS